MNRLTRHLRFKRIRVQIHSPEVLSLIEGMQVRIDREHRWVHDLEDVIAELRNRIDDGLELCARAGTSKADVAAALNNRRSAEGDPQP